MSKFGTQTDDLLVVACGSPQVFLATKDTSQWYLLDERAYDQAFDHQVDISSGEEYTVMIGGGRARIMTSDELLDCLRPERVALLRCTGVRQKAMATVSNLRRFIA